MNRLFPYPCLNTKCVGDGVSTFYARNNDAKYGHVCHECHKSFNTTERGHYVHQIKVHET